MSKSINRSFILDAIHTGPVTVFTSEGEIINLADADLLFGNYPENSYVLSHGRKWAIRVKDEWTGFLFWDFVDDIQTVPKEIKLKATLLNLTWKE